MTALQIRVVALARASYVLNACGSDDVSDTVFAYGLASDACSAAERNDAARLCRDMMNAALATIRDALPRDTPSELRRATVRPCTCADADCVLCDDAGMVPR